MSRPAIPSPAIARVQTGSPWEDRYGYCRAMRIPLSADADLIVVTGTAPVNADGSVHAPGDAHAQTTKCLEIISGALSQLGAGAGHIVRSRLFVTDIARADEFGLAHRAFFGPHRPCLTMVGVSALIDPAMLVEVEAEAVVLNPERAGSSGTGMEHGA